MSEPIGASGLSVVPIAGALAMFADATASPADANGDAMAAHAASAIGERAGLPVPVLFARQRHTRLVFTYSAERPLAPGPHLVGTCDALLTAEPGVALLVQTADCLPVAFAGDGVVGIVHAGWRGLAADILSAALRRLDLEFGVAPERIDAAIGVGVGPCHYPVGREVIASLGAVDVGGGEWRGDGRVDLAAWARGRLAALGVAEMRIRVLPGCTACSPRYHSFRRDGTGAGRQWSAVILPQA